MSLHKFILIAFFIHTVSSDECVSYTFEEGFESLFNNNEGVCAALAQVWEKKQYCLSDIDPPNEFSTKYISPKASLWPSCVSSFIFRISAQGVLEFNVYMAGDSPGDQLTILVSQYVAGGNHNAVGTLFLHPGAPNFVRGWSSHRISVIGSGTFDAYVSILGMAGEDSKVLVDSFRYIPPSLTDADCPVY